MNFLKVVSNLLPHFTGNAVEHEYSPLLARFTDVRVLTEGKFLNLVQIINYSTFILCYKNLMQCSSGTRRNIFYHIY